ncbi:YppG family protein [Salirhabdus salicampi]|uniref:YppG family protein n=1 Tax=Salirhabdus salicampi TaxID=476102 RepID=UPI0020C20AF8|nr:YppG family protein [Salirhabdus salicampi]MCP8618098.1 YppG family protein [Salirhabdus salicampi]
MNLHPRTNWGNQLHQYQTTPMQQPYQSFSQTMMPQIPQHQGNVQYQSPYEQFMKPPIPMENYAHHQPHQHHYMPKPNHPLIQHFQGQDGQVDFDKVFNTVGQLVNTAHQVAPIIKGLSTLAKSFKV